jgi:hypothetical protein
MKKQIFTLVLLLLTFCVSTQAQEENNPVIYQAFVRDGRVVDDNGGYISILDALTLKELGQIDLVSFDPQRIEITKDRKRAFVNHTPGTDRKGVVVVDFEQKRVIRKLFDNTSVYEMKLAPNGTMWILLNEPKEIVIVEPDSLQVRERITLDESPRNIIFSSDGQKAYVSLFTKDVVVLNAINGNKIAVIENLPERDKILVRPQELALSSDDKFLFVGSKETVSVVETRLFQVVSRFKIENTTGFLGGDLLLKIDPNTNFLYACGYFGTRLSVYDTNKMQLIKVLPIPSLGDLGQSTGIITYLQLSPNKDVLYVNQFYGVSFLELQNNTFFANTLTSSGRGFPNPFSLGLVPTGDFSIGQAPTLQTTSPTTSQQVIAGQPLTIRWNTTVAPQSYAIASHKVELSTDGGSTFTTIPGAGRLSAEAQEFTWQVPSDIEIQNKVQIRVSTVDLGARRADSPTGNFSIIKMPTGDTQAPMVNFLSPKGGERFTSGDNLQITWMSSDNVAVTSQDLSLSTDGGNTFPITLASGLPATTQSFSFPIPMSLQSDQARLRLIVRDSAGNMSQALTPSSFRIELGADTIAPVVTIAQPSANQRLIAGQPIDVKWQSTDNRQLVSQTLQLSLDGGKTFATVANFGASDNSFIINNIEELNITNAQGIVRITATDTSGNIGQASVMFSTSSAITSATYQAKILSLTGIGFISNANGSTTKLFVNEREITITPTMLSNNSLTIKGNKKKLGIARGNNTVRLLVNGVSSNTLPFTF